MVRRIWGEMCVAETHEEWSKRTGIVLENIAPDEKIIWIQPGETILAHTQEFIGGRGSVTTMMKARSSLGRNFIEVCKVLISKFALSFKAENSSSPPPPPYTPVRRLGRCRLL